MKRKQIGWGMSLGHFGQERSLGTPSGELRSALTQPQCYRLSFQVRMVWLSALLFPARTSPALLPRLI